MAGHVLLETGGDALFLANVAVERLPLLTIAIALVALVVARGPRERGNRSMLLALQATASVGTLAFWSLSLATQQWTYYALYLWAGIITSLIVLRFWLLLADLFTITEGKRLFAAIAMGGSLGALLGSGVAALLAPRFGGQGLLVASAVAYAASALGPGLALGRSADAVREVSRDESGQDTGLAASIRGVLHNPYASRVALLVMFGGVTLTLGDYLFKSVIAEEVAADDLASWLSKIYLGLNLLSIGMLAVGVTPLVRWLGVDRSLAVLPGLIGLAAIGVSLGAGLGGVLAAIIFLKVVDGSLRYSLHKTASELLYLPMSSSLRASVKGAIDIVGQTGAKALASLLILGLVLLPEARLAVAIAVALSASAWLVSALRLRRSYLNIFRQTLREGTIETAIEHPELDLESVASLTRALSDPDDRRSIAAMRILVERGHVALIPNLILYHPSPRVVAHALDVFALSHRDDLTGLISHLLDHEDANVRAASVRATWALDPDLDRLRSLRTSHCAAIRVSALAGLLALGEAESEEYQAVLDEAIAYETYEPRLAASTAARLRYHPINREALLRMAGDDHIEVAQEAIRAIRGSGDDWFTERLVDLLGDRQIRDDVRDALMDRGETALHQLAARLVDETTSVAVLPHIPRTIARFATPEAARVLIESLPRVAGGMVRFKVLRGLETLLLGRGRPKGEELHIAAAVDMRGIRAEFDRTLERSLDLLLLEAEFSKKQTLLPELATSVGALLVNLLEDKVKLASGRLFIMLGLLYPNEDFRSIHAGIASTDATDHASASELIETLLSLDVGRAVMGLVIKGSAEARLAVAAPGRRRDDFDYGEALQTLLADDSCSVRAVALYHAGEVGLQRDPEGGPSVSRMDGARLAGAAGLKERALAVLRDLSERRPRPGIGPVPAS